MDALLARWDRQILINTVKHAPEDIHPAVRANGSALRSGAGQADISAVEQRIGQPLPPSYREFLTRSNGAFGSIFAQLSEEPGPRLLFDAGSVGLTKRVSFEQAAGCILEMGGDNWPDDWGRTDADRVAHERAEHDEASYLYGVPGAAANDWGFKLGQAMHTVTIGDWGGQGELLLNPLVMDGRGEWEVIELHHFSMMRFASFGEWLSHTVNTLEMHNPDDGAPIEIPAFPEHPRPQSTAAYPTIWHTMYPLLQRGDIDAATAAVEAAVAADRSFMHDTGLAATIAFELATYDTPAVWRTLEVMATAPYDGHHISIMAAGTTSAPYVTQLASAAMAAESESSGYGIRGGVYGQLALELHQLDASSDLLNLIANEGELWALRALGRRRDKRALLPALGMLSSTTSEAALSGAEILRDLRDPDSVLALDQTLRSSTDPNLTITAAHALVMINPTAAKESLDNPGALTTAGRALVELWQDQTNQTDPSGKPPV